MAGRRLLNLAFVTMLLLAPVGCKRGTDAVSGDGGSTTSSPPLESTTTEPAPRSTATPSYAVPDVIDAAYVETVMKALDQVYGDAIRIMARDRYLSDAFLNHLLAIYTSEQFERTQEAWVLDISQGLQGLYPSAGDPSTVVQRVVKPSRECILAAVIRDFSATRDKPQEPTPQHYIGLVPRVDGKDRLNVNPTPWMMSFDGFIVTGEEPERPCVRE